MKTICVFCSASDVSEVYRNAAEEFGKLMVSHGYDLVWGGSEMGIMKVVADAVQNAGGKLYGVSVEFLHDKARQNADEMIITKDLAERKKLLLDKGDAVVLLVGGVGSLDEVAEIIELKKQNIHNKPVVILNTDNFYEGLLLQLNRMYTEHFINRPVDELVKIVPSPEEAIEYIESVLKS
jgi:uncharacterized protein (TIGR00730 family)